MFGRKIKKHLPHSHVTLVFIHDVIMAILVYPLANWARLGNDVQYVFQHKAFYIGWPSFVITAILIIYYLDMYRGYWRYASIRDLRVILMASFISTVVFIVTQFIFIRMDSIPRTLPFILFVGLFIAWAGPRLLFRVWREGGQFIYNFQYSKQKTHKIPIIMYGAVDVIEPFLKAQMRFREHPYRVVGIISHKIEVAGRELHGVPLLGGLENLENLLHEHRLVPRPERIVLALKSNERSADHLKEVADFAERNMLPISRLPALDELKEGVDDALLSLQSIPLEDLLGRAQQKLDPALLSNLLKEKTVLVTGAGGSIGAELCYQIGLHAPKALILVDHSEYALYLIDLALQEKYPDLVKTSLLGDVRNLRAMERIFKNHLPDIVIHAAAYKHVPLVETNPLEGLGTNVFGTKHIAQLAMRYKASLMVQISTDKVVRPTNIMGAAKRIAEASLQYYDLSKQTDIDKTRFAIVRFGNVLGSTGSVIPLFERQLRRGGPLTVTHKDVTRYFMTVKEAVQLVLSAGAITHGFTESRGAIYILDMGEPVKIDDLARRMISLAGFRPMEEVSIEYTGLRAGEKLYEELRYDDETPSPTKIDGLTIAHPALIEKDVFETYMAHLEQAIQAGDEAIAMDVLKKLVPEYNPSS